MKHVSNKYGLLRSFFNNAIPDPVTDCLEFQLTHTDISDTPRVKIPAAEYEPETFLHDDKYLEFKQQLNSQQSDSDSFFNEEGSSSGFSADANLDEKQSTVCLFGRTKEGVSVSCIVPYRPYVMVEVPLHWKTREFSLFSSWLASKLQLQEHKVTVRHQMSHHFFGYEPEPGNPTQRKVFSFLKVSVDSVAAMKAIGRKLKYPIWVPSLGDKIQLQVHELIIDPLTKFFDDLQIQPSSWVRVKDGLWKYATDYATHSQVEFTVFGLSSFEQIKGRDDIAPYLVACTDIEQWSLEGDFPVNERIEDSVITISTTFKRIGTGCTSEPLVRVVQCLRRTNPVEGCIIEDFETEDELLNAWRDLIVVHADPDIFTHYNGCLYDLPCMAARKKHYLKPSYSDELDAYRFFYLSRFIATFTPLTSESFESDAYGQSDTFTFHMHGRVYFDLYQHLKREKPNNMKKFKLNDVAEHLLKDKKVDLDYKEMFRLFPLGPAERAIIAHYCSKDSDLPILILEFLSTLPNLIEMSKVTWTTIIYIFTRGQQIKVLNQICIVGHQHNVVITYDPSVNVDSTYTGATVLEAKKGWYPLPVVTLDFNSLYPSVMKMLNLSPDTLLINKEYWNLDNLPKRKTTTDRAEYMWVTHVVGLLPMILDNLLTERGKVKKEMKKEKDPERYKMLDGKQKALKISANSIYGFTGAVLKGKLPCLPVADATTAGGRDLIQRTSKALVEDFPKEMPEYIGTEVLYGDSVTGDTPVLFRHNGVIDYITIESMATFGKWRSYHGDKESICLTSLGLCVWTDKGFTKINRLIRHKTNKDIIRVATPSGVVEVTTDHSLLTPDGKKITSKEVKIGDSLLHHALPIENTTDTDPTTYAPNGFVVPGVSNIINNIVLASCPTMLRSLWYEFCHIIGCEANKIHATNKIMAAQVYFMMTKVGYEVTVAVEAQDSYTLTGVKIGGEANTSPDRCKIISMTNLGPCNDFVYDLETESHHFAAGVGEMIVHNTDSVFVRFPVTPDQAGLEEAFRLGEIAAEKISKEVLNGAVVLEQEKVYFPYMSLKKKRYAGLKFTHPNKPGEFDAKGLELVRGDACKFIVDTQKEVLNHLLYERDAEAAKRSVDIRCEKMVNDEISRDDFIFSASLKRNYANENVAQLVVTRQIRERAPGTEPKTGDRVQFVVCDPKRPKDPMYTKVQDPAWAEQQGMDLDLLYIVNNKMSASIGQFFEPFYDDPDKMFDTVRYKLKNKRDRCTEITKFFSGGSEGKMKRKAVYNKPGTLPSSTSNTPSSISSTSSNTLSKSNTPSSISSTSSNTSSSTSSTSPNTTLSISSSSSNTAPSKSKPEFASTTAATAIQPTLSSKQATLASKSTFSTSSSTSKPTKRAKTSTTSSTTAPKNTLFQFLTAKK